MHRAVLIASLALVACSATGGNRATDLRSLPPHGTAAPATGDGPFSGVWQACEGAASPGECSRYVLVQRGDRICGTWAYVASGDGYDGRLVARAASPTEARRVQVCGRPGSEARTECDAGWDSVNRPLRLCDGRLADLDAADGTCRADYVRAGAGSELAELVQLAREPWLQACLEGTEAAR